MNSILPFEYYLPLISDHSKLKKKVFYPEYLDEDYLDYKLFDLESFRKSVKRRARGEQIF